MKLFIFGSWPDIPEDPDEDFLCNWPGDGSEFAVQYAKQHGMKTWWDEEEEIEKKKKREKMERKENEFSFERQERIEAQMAGALSHNQPRLLDIRNYRRNILANRPGTDQIPWIVGAKDYLMEVLNLEPIAMRHIVRLSQEIVADGQVANLPRLINRLDEKDMSQRAILNRLLSLVMIHENVFGCDYGYDMESLFSEKPTTNKQDLDPKLLDYLRLIHENPGMPATARDKMFGVLPKYGTEYRRQLMAAGLIDQIEVTGPNGKYFKDFRVTAAGAGLLVRAIHNRGESPVLCRFIPALTAPLVFGRKQAGRLLPGHAKEIPFTRVVFRNCEYI